MPNADLHHAALEFVNGQDAGRQPTLQEYLLRFPSRASEFLDLVADYAILDALARPAPAAVPQAA